MQRFSTGLAYITLVPDWRHVHKIKVGPSWMLHGSLLEPRFEQGLIGEKVHFKFSMHESFTGEAVVAVTTSLGLERGFADSIFGMSVVFAVIVMYDAQFFAFFSGACPSPRRPRHETLHRRRQCRPPLPPATTVSSSSPAVSSSPTGSGLLSHQRFILQHKEMGIAGTVVKGIMRHWSATIC